MTREHSAQIDFYLPEVAFEGIDAEFTFAPEWDHGGEYGPSGWIINDVALRQVRLGKLYLDRPQMVAMLGEDAVATIEADQVEPITLAMQYGDYSVAAQ